MEGMRHTVLQMVVQDLLLDFVQCRPYRAHLVDDIDAVAVFLDHACNTAYLAFDATKSCELRFLDPFVHA